MRCGAVRCGVGVCVDGSAEQKMGKKRIFICGGGRWVSKMVIPRKFVETR